MPVGLDTGFFYALRAGDAEAVRVWDEEAELVVSVLTLFELRRAHLRQNRDDLLRDVRRAVTVVPVTAPVAVRAARLAAETGMSAVGALILASLLHAGCDRIYTLDTDFERYRSGRVRIVRLGGRGGP